MSKLILGGTDIRYVDMRYEEQAQQVFHRIHCTADLKKNLVEQMDWDILDDDGQLRSGLGSCPLTGSRPLTEFTLTPNGLQQHAVSLEALEVSDFKLKVSDFKLKVRAGEEEDDVPELRVAFTIVSTSKAAKLLEVFLERVGHGKGQLKCTLGEEEQTELPSMEGHKKKRGKAADPEPEEEEQETEEEEEVAAGPVLASVNQMKRTAQ